MPSMLRNKGEPVEWRSTRRELFKPKLKQPQVPLPIRARKTGKTGLSLILQEEEIDSADFVKDLVTQRPDAGSNQMPYVNIARKEAMLKGFTKKKTNLTRINHNTRLLRLE